MKTYYLLLFYLPILLTAESISLINNNQSQWCIIHPLQWVEEPSEQVVIYKTTAQEQAKRLQSYIERSTGVKLPIYNRPMKTRIEFTKAALGTLDQEGFSFTFPEPNHILITVGGTRALEYAVTEFLERYVGIRWIFPTELGTVIPKHSSITIDTTPVHMKPSFLGRYLSGGNGGKPDNDAYYRWMLVNKGNFMERGGHAQHNLWRLLPVTKHHKNHPEYYPILKGKRCLTTSAINWQPCFTEPGIVNAVIANIPPGKSRVSLQVNDGNGFCECKRCLAVDGTRMNFVGQRDRSRSYLNFCNAVARKRPDIEFWIGGYWSVIECPSDIKLEKNLRYCLAYETFQWTDPLRFKHTQELMKRWAKASDHSFSWYDYVYGGHYPVPRIFARQLGNTLKWRYQHNTRYMTGEYYPRGRWDDSINIYVWLKLAWNINADIDALIDDYCKAAVGEKAAPYLKKYFAAYEKVWTSPDILKADCFKHEATYFSPDSTFYEAFPDDFADQCEKLLQNVLKYTNCRERAEYFYRKFREIKPYLQ